MGAKLNSEQQRAVEKVEGALLILAGAGSGKTRVLTHRIANLIEEGHALPGEILAVTFTNKAAKEMKSRIEALLGGKGIPVAQMWVSTFHSIGARLLREYGQNIGLQSGFSIFDQGDQLTLIKTCLKQLGISDKVLVPKAVMARINQLKNDAIDPRDFKPSANRFYDAKIAPVAKMYEEQLWQQNAVDFGDLLFKTYKLLKEHENLRLRLQDQFRFIMVDEYQDTNPVQFMWLQLLAAKHRNLCVVGDEDQSIYKWRGADIQNILDFQKHFPEAEIIKLEQNYRSSAHIIRAASHVIQKNRNRYEKKLFTENSDGDQVGIHYFDGDFDEAKYVVGDVKRRMDKGLSLNEAVIFYRTHAQSRLFEDTLRHYGIPYKIYGGLKFYDRAEIKNAISYLRVMANPRDDISILRIVNVPARGIGKTSLTKIREYSLNHNISCLEAMSLAAKGEPIVGTAARRKLKDFMRLYEKLFDQSTEMLPEEFYHQMLQDTGYIKFLEKDDSIESQTRIENLRELASAIADYQQRAEEASIEGFLEEVTLVDQLDQVDGEVEHSLTLMTLHSSKGLEFPVVYMVGMEEELFPSVRVNDPEPIEEQVEEERRLCYVGMTRAEQSLNMTCAGVRRLWGRTQVRRSSRFLEEMPDGEVRVFDHRVNRLPAWEDDSDRVVGFASRKSKSSGKSVQTKEFDDFGDFGDEFGGAFGGDETEDGFRIGARVNHPVFGNGVVSKREGSGSGLKLSINFRVGAKTKKFLLKFAPLELIP